MKNVPNPVPNLPEEEGGQPPFEPMECFSPRYGDVLSLLFGLALTVLAIGLTVIGPSADTVWEVVLGRLLFGAISVWGGFISLRWLLRMRDSQPRLALTADGIIDRSSLGRPVCIPWDQITSIEPTSKGTLDVGVKDPGLLRLSLQRRFLGWFLRKTPGTHVVIPIRLLDVPSSDIIHRVMEVHEAMLVRSLRESKESFRGVLNDSGP